VIYHFVYVSIYERKYFELVFIACQRSQIILHAVKVTNNAFLHQIIIVCTQRINAFNSKKFEKLLLLKKNFKVSGP